MWIAQPVKRQDVVSLKCGLRRGDDNNDENDDELMHILNKVQTRQPQSD